MVRALKKHKLQKLNGETRDVDLSHFLEHVPEVKDDHDDHGVYLQGGREFDLNTFRSAAK